jgi:hypothetical protein
MTCYLTQGVQAHSDQAGRLIICLGNSLRSDL